MHPAPTPRSTERPATDSPRGTLRLLAPLQTIRLRGRTADQLGSGRQTLFTTIFRPAELSRILASFMTQLLTPFMEIRIQASLVERLAKLAPRSPVSMEATFLITPAAVALPGSVSSRSLEYGKQATSILSGTLSRAMTSTSQSSNRFHYPRRTTPRYSRLRGIKLLWGALPEQAAPVQYGQRVQVRRPVTELC